MTTPVLSERVQTLEEMVAEQTRNVDRLIARMDERDREAKERNAELSRELAEISRESAERFEQFERRMDRMQQEIAASLHKQGRMAEDMVAPSIPRVLATVLGSTSRPTLEAVRLKKRLDNGHGRMREFDVVAICDTYLLICEVKTQLRSQDISAFLDSLQEVRTFLPEYGDYQILGAMATFYIDESMVKWGERQGLMMLGVMNGLMEVLNSEHFVPTTF